MMLPSNIQIILQGTTRQLLHDRIRDAYVHPQFVADVMRPLKIDDIIDQEVNKVDKFYTLILTFLLALLFNVHQDPCLLFPFPNINVIFAHRSKTFLVVSFSVLPLPSVLESPLMSTLLMSPGTV